MTTGEEHPRSILGSDSVGEQPASGVPGGGATRPVVRLDPGDPAQRRRPRGLFDVPPSVLDSTGEQPVRTPFLATTGQLPAITSQTRLERLLDGAQRWRTFLGLSLAAVMTIVIVAVYRSPAGPGGELTSVAGPSTSEVRSAVEAVTDFDSATTSAPTTTVTGQTQVASEVDDSLNSSGQEQPAPTATQAPSVASTEEETSSSVSSSTLPEATTTVIAEVDPDSSTSSDSSSTTTTTTDDATTDPTAETMIKVEAEDGRALRTASAKSDHAGYSGTGYIGEIFLEGGGVTFTVEDHPGGPTPLRIRYAAGDNVDPGGPRSLSLMVNGTTISQVSMPESGAWSDWWDLNAGDIDLAAGTNTITLLWLPGDTGWVNIDYIELG